MRDNKDDPKKFLRTPKRKGGFFYDERIKITRKEARKHLVQWNLACELSRTIRHFFPDLVSMLKKLPDPRHQSYITYPGVLLLMTRILSSLFYLSSMRKASEELNSDAIIENLWAICGESPTIDEIPYWETINRYLKKIEPSKLQEIIWQLCRRLIRSRAFAQAKIRGKYWQVIIDGTQLYSSREKLDETCPFRIHNKGTAEEYRENYCYVVEAKLVLHPGILVSIMTEFVENDEKEEREKQDCERKACFRLMERLKQEFPRLPLCLSADSLYACERFFRECREKKWHFLLRLKENSIPYVWDEYKSLRKREKNYQKKIFKDGWGEYDYVNKIDYQGNLLNLVEYQEERTKKIQKGKNHGKKRNCRKRFLFLTDLPVTKRNVAKTVEDGRKRWRIENEGFHTQKKQGYFLEHRYSKDYQAMKNHYYLIQIGHMIAQIMECRAGIWKQVKQSREQKHRRILESFKKERIKEFLSLPERKVQMRFI